MLPSWISWLIKNNAIKATVSDDTVAFLLYWCGMVNHVAHFPFSIPNYFSGGVIATFMTPSRRFSNRSYAASISFSGKICVMSGVVSS